MKRRLVGSVVIAGVVLGGMAILARAGGQTAPASGVVTLKGAEVAKAFESRYR